MDLLSILGTICSIAGAVVAAWQAYRAKTFRDEIVHDRVKMLLIDVIGTAKRARSECQKIMTSVNKRVRGVDQQAVINLIRGCIEKLRDNSHHLSSQPLNQAISSLEGKMAKYVTGSEEERSRIADDMYRDLAEVVRVVSQKLEQELQEERNLTNPLHRIAARLRFGVNVKGFGLGGKRWPGTLARCVIHKGREYEL